MGLFKRKAKFNAVHLKTRLKLSMIEITQEMGRRDNEIINHKNELRKILQQPETQVMNDQLKVRILVQKITRHQMERRAIEQLSHFCDLLVQRVDLIAQSDSMPIHDKVAIHSLVFAASRLQLGKLKEAKDDFVLKYGKKILVEADNSDSVLDEIKNALQGSDVDNFKFEKLKALAEEFEVDIDYFYKPDKKNEEEDYGQNDNVHGDPNNFQGSNTQPWEDHVVNFEAPPPIVSQQQQQNMQQQEYHMPQQQQPLNPPTQPKNNFANKYVPIDFTMPPKNLQNENPGQYYPNPNAQHPLPQMNKNNHNDFQQNQTNFEQQSQQYNKNEFNANQNYNSQNYNSPQHNGQHTNNQNFNIGNNNQWKQQNTQNFNDNTPTNFQNNNSENFHQGSNIDSDLAEAFSKISSGGNSLNPSAPSTNMTDLFSLTLDSVPTASLPRNGDDPNFQNNQNMGGFQQQAGNGNANQSSDTNLEDAWNEIMQG